MLILWLCILHLIPLIPLIPAFNIKYNYKVPFITEVNNIDINSVDMDTMKQLKHLFQSTPVLVFKNQRVSPQAHFEFCSKFDSKYTTDVVHPFPTTAVPECPQIALRGKGQIENIFGVQNQIISNRETFEYTPVWHQDLVGTRDRQPTKVSSIYMLQPSKNGGSTLFASMEKGYENMNNDCKHLYDNLQACYSSKLGLNAIMDHTGYSRIDREVNYNVETMKQLQDDVVIQPLVIYPDESSRKRSLLLSPDTFCGFLGLPLQKSKTIMNKIMSNYVLTESNTAELIYEQYDLVMFNNRRVIHSSTPTSEIEGSRIISMLLLDTKERFVSNIPFPLSRGCIDLYKDRDI